jgi:hypothetical protein
MLQLRRFSLLILASLLLCLASAGVARADAVTFVANLTGSQEVPANASAATGFATVVLNAAQNQITVNVSFSGLSAPATAGHIHGPAAPGSNAPVLFPFAGVPNATSGNIPEQTFAITPTQVAQLFGGLFYVNIHSSNFPGGEIRGQLVQTPEPATLTLLMTGIAGVGTVVRKRRKAA